MAQEFLTDLLLRLWSRIGRLRNWTESSTSVVKGSALSLWQGLHPRKVTCCVVLPVFCKVFLLRWYADEDFFVSIYTLNFEISSVGIKVITALTDEYVPYFPS